MDIFEPAIIKANFEAYRIDNDLSVRIPIDDIEKGISESAICFAEITLDNPNVWYELGFAFACNKDVVMVCSDEREGKFPFDIQHRQVITYKTGSTSDFDKLGDAIAGKIDALQRRAKTVKQLHKTPVIETEGLKGHEIALIMLIMEDQVSSIEGTSVFSLKKEMDMAGYNGAATSVGITSLEKNNMVETFLQADHWSNEQPYKACSLTEKGVGWILSNQDKLEFRKVNNDPTTNDDVLPF